MDCGHAGASDCPSTHCLGSSKILLLKQKEAFLSERWIMGLFGLFALLFAGILVPVEGRTRGMSEDWIAAQVWGLRLGGVLFVVYALLGW